MCGFANVRISLISAFLFKTIQENYVNPCSYCVYVVKNPKSI